MSFLAIVGISIFVSLDSFSIALTTGSINKGITYIRWLIVSLFFGVFQFIAVLFGFYLGKEFEIIAIWGYRLISFLIFTLVGVKIFHDFLSEKKNNIIENLNFSFKNIIILSVATGLDSFATGIKLSYFENNVMILSIMAAVTTFVFTIIGLLIGKQMQKLLLYEAKVFGALILLAISIKILMEAFLT